MWLTKIHHGLKGCVTSLKGVNIVIFAACLDFMLKAMQTHYICKYIVCSLQLFNIITIEVAFKLSFLGLF